MCFFLIWFSLQKKWISVNEDTLILKEIEQMSAITYFYSFTTQNYSTIKIKKIQQTILETKNPLRNLRFYGGPFVLEISVFVRGCYLNSNFFRVLQSSLLKNEKKYILKKDTSHLKIAWHSNRQKKNIEKKEKWKWEKIKQKQ